jgi:hypothetical protein
MEWGFQTCQEIEAEIGIDVKTEHVNVVTHHRNLQA